MNFKRALFSLLAVAVCAAAWSGDLGGLRQKAERLHTEGKNDSAIIVGEKALRMAVESGDSTAMMGAHSSLAVYLRTAGRIDEALRHYDKALEVCTRDAFKFSANEDVRQETATLFLNLATLHVDMKHKEDAMYYGRMAEKWCNLCIDYNFKAKLLSQNGLIFMICGDNHTASRQFTDGYSMALYKKDYTTALTSAAYMMAVADRLGNKRSETYWRGQCEKLAAQVTDVMALAAYYQIMCGIEMNRGNWREAITLFDKILSLDGIDKMPFVVYDCYNNMHDAWAKLGQWEEAYLALGKATALKDSLFESQKAESLRELTVKYKAKESELALARSEATLANTRMYIAVAALVVLVCAVLVSLYVQSQRRKMRVREEEYIKLKAETDRRLTERYLAGLECERERLAKELHDGVCNSLYTVELMMARPQPEQPKADSDAPEGGEAKRDVKSMVAECREQVRRISHELMPPEFYYADVSVVIEDYLDRISEAAPCTLGFLAEPFESEWTGVPDTVALELYRITQEAVNNAIRHSHPSKVNVILRQYPVDGKVEGYGTIRLTVIDNGKPSDSPAAGIGRRTMRQRAEAMGGRLETRREGDRTFVEVILER